jgi:hypothetical protein
LKFKDTIENKSDVDTKGKWTFFQIYSAINGGVDKLIGTMYERSLNNLDKNLDYEIKTFSVKNNGLITKPQPFYVAQSLQVRFLK